MPTHVSLLNQIPAERVRVRHRPPPNSLSACGRAWCSVAGCFEATRAARYRASCALPAVPQCPNPVDCEEVDLSLKPSFLSNSPRAGHKKQEAQSELATPASSCGLTWPKERAHLRQHIERPLRLRKVHARNGAELGHNHVLCVVVQGAGGAASATCGGRHSTHCRANPQSTWSWKVVASMLLGSSECRHPLDPLCILPHPVTFTLQLRLPRPPLAV